MIQEISAEMFLACLYPEVGDSWEVTDKGTFYRNYSSDVLDVEPGERTVKLARDNFLRLLPQELLSSEKELSALKERKNVDFDAVYEQIQRRLKLLGEAFRPFDTFEFRTRLDFEHVLEKILGEKKEAVLREVYGFDISGLRDDYVFLAALLLPCFRSMRGDPESVRSLLSTVLDTEVTVKMSDWSGRDQTVFSMPKMTFSVIYDSLEPEQFISMCSRIRPLAEFVIERLAPADVFCEISVKGSSENKNILDYNFVI